MGYGYQLDTIVAVVPLELSKMAGSTELERRLWKCVGRMRQLTGRGLTAIGGRVATHSLRSA